VSSCRARTSSNSFFNRANYYLRAFPAPSACSRETAMDLFLAEPVRFHPFKFPKGGSSVTALHLNC
jgi:hypothetical protein